MGISHEERTAAEPRENCIHSVILNEIKTVNESIRLLLKIPEGKTINFRPGQWVDLHIPGLPQAGGFTIVSAPGFASANCKNGYLELAVQRSPQNPAVSWLWRKDSEVLGTELQVQVGGSFTWPPSNLDEQQIKKVVFIAGGVGINPLYCMLDHLCHHSPHHPLSVQFLYTTKVPRMGYTCIHFLLPLKSAFTSPPSPSWNLHLHLTGHYNPSSFTTISKGANIESIFSKETEDLEANQSVRHRRITWEDVLSALGPVTERAGVVAYVCGPRGLTDEFVEVLKSQEGMEEKRVLCEKWW